MGEADVEDAPGVRQQPQVAVPVVRRDAPDFGQRVVQRAAVVEVIAIGKTEAVPRRQRNQLDVIGQPLAEQLEQLLEQEGRGDHGRAGVMAEAVALEDPGPTAELLAPVQQRDPIAFGPQAQGCGNAAITGAHHHGVRNFSHPARCQPLAQWRLVAPDPRP